VSAGFESTDELPNGSRAIMADGWPGGPKKKKVAAERHCCVYFDFASLH
jgi:hypothetical protein